MRWYFRFFFRGRSWYLWLNNNFQLVRHGGIYIRLDALYFALIQQESACTKINLA
jgi:hypothetical protein